MGSWSPPVPLPEPQAFASDHSVVVVGQKQTWNHGLALSSLEVSIWTFLPYYTNAIAVSKMLFCIYIHWDPQNNSEIQAEH